MATPSDSDPSGDSSHWGLIGREIEAWKSAGRAPQFWWRDDDARRPSKALARLLSLSSACNVPVALAVIPDVDLTDLAATIRDRPLVSAVQHGCQHVNRNKGGAFQAEFAPDCPVAEVAAAVNAGWDRLSTAMDAAPLYAPPWNNLTPNVRLALADTPLRAVSRFGPLREVSDRLSEINVHVNIADWGPPRFRGAKAILDRMWRELRSRRHHRSWDEPIGLITHHMNADADSWTFLEAFLPRATAAGSGFQWRAVAELMA